MSRYTIRLLYHYLIRSLAFYVKVPTVYRLRVNVHQKFNIHTINIRVLAYIHSRIRCKHVASYIFCTQVLCRPRSELLFELDRGFCTVFFVAVFCFLFSKRYKIWCIETINMNLYTPHFFWGCIISFSLQKYFIISFWLSFLWKLKRDYFFYQWWCLKVFRISNLFFRIYTWGNACA